MILFVSNDISCFNDLAVSGTIYVLISNLITFQLETSETAVLWRQINQDYCVYNQWLVWLSLHFKQHLLHGFSILFKTWQIVFLSIQSKIVVVNLAHLTSTASVSNVKLGFISKCSEFGPNEEIL